ncbi:hypothetical protein CICLE_v10030414mg [Citrus x clementina]|uniref:Uncharacterized protein n=1 Tax=Citrus clementina TaxID=85681 RepID=V4SJS1_CITCL|nr:hypothetical protein CICLE_v10030414mg [Citrus x clementina]
MLEPLFMEVFGSHLNTCVLVIHIMCCCQNKYALNDLGFYKVKISYSYNFEKGMGLQGDHIKQIISNY